MFKLAIVAAAWWRANRLAHAAISEPDAYAFYHPGGYALSQGGVIGFFVSRFHMCSPSNQTGEQENDK
jgi:hypothetical protein